MNLPAAFRDQAGTCGRLGSPFMARLLTLLADTWPDDSAIGRAMNRYEGDIGPAGHSLPLRIAGGLHALVLSGRDPELAAVYPPNAPGTDALRGAVLAALSRHMDFMLDWTASAPQTNEVRRSAPLIAMARVAIRQFDRPVVLSELGASGGLNLMWDRYALDIGDAVLGPASAALTLAPDWTGPTPPAVVPRVVARAGVDLNPIDVTTPDGVLRLTAYLWPDQPERLSLTRRAIDAFDASLERGGAIEWLAKRLAIPHDGHLHLIQHSVAWQYFSPADQARGRALIEAAGQRATPEAPLAWMAMESDGDTTGTAGAALTLRLWPGDLTFALGRADFHGRWVRWQGV